MIYPYVIRQHSTTMINDLCERFISTTLVKDSCQHEMS